MDNHFPFEMVLSATRPHAPFLSFKVLAQAEDCWRQAEKAAANDREKLARVQAGHLAVQFAFLRDWKSLHEECENQKGVWPFTESRGTLAGQFARACKNIPGNHDQRAIVLSEGGLTSDKFLKQLTQEAH